MSRMTFSNKWGRVAVSKKPLKPETQKSLEDTVREMKNAAKTPGGEDYREKSLSIHGLVCARCGREFSGVNRQLLTVHHKDGNHHNNPPDGSNWENLCAYCHEDVHSREVLSEYLSGDPSSQEASLVYEDTSVSSSGSESLLAQKLKRAMQKKK
jgi:predicted HNH restriction endonuclease